MISSVVVRSGRIAAGCTLGLALSCAERAEPRAQLLLFVDTDTPLFAQLDTQSQALRAAAIDMLHVEILGVNGAVQESRNIVALNVSDWPISFGVVPSGGDARHLSIRLRGLSSGHVPSTDAQTLAASANVIIDRLVEVDVGSGVTARRVTLRGDCMGVRTTFATFGAPATTCVDAAQRHGSPSEGLASVDVDEPRATLAGSWALAIEAPCTAPAPEGAVCIPGGVSVLGELSLAGFSDGLTGWDPVPLRPAALSPFYLDRVEITVGRVRGLVKAQRVDPPPASAPGPFGECQWLGEDDAKNDAMPMNCVSQKVAESVCSALGGTLPSEAQWEHAARGRGEGNRYPWGSMEPECCSAAFGATSATYGDCPDATIAAAGVHANSPCEGPHDVSRDGVADLAGNLSEWMRDAFAPYDAPCWPEGITLDPRCADPTLASEVSRGGDFASPVWQLAASLRFTPGSLPRATQGFRCAYPGSPP